MNDSQGRIFLLALIFRKPSLVNIKSVPYLRPVFSIIYLSMTFEYPFPLCAVRIKTVPVLKQHSNAFICVRTKEQVERMTDLFSKD